MSRPLDLLKSLHSEVLKSDLPRPAEGLFTFSVSSGFPSITPYELISIDSDSDLIKVLKTDFPAESLSIHQRASGCFQWEPNGRQVRIYGYISKICDKGLVIKIDEVEFWTRKPYRIHDRDVYEHRQGSWSHRKLYP